MPELVFKGTVLPPDYQLNVRGLPVFRIEWKEENLTADFNVEIVNSLVEVKCNANRFDKEEHLSWMAMHANNLSRGVVDAWCFWRGFGFMVYLGKVVHPNGEERTLAAKTDCVEGLCTSFNLDPSFVGPNNFDTMVRIVISETSVLLALNDLITCVSQFHLAPINCARSIEALRNAIAPSTADRDEQWKLMREKLNISKGFLSSITTESKGPRHGDRKSAQSISQAELLKRAWTVMNRFLEYRKGGNQPLPGTHFPILDA